MEEYYKHKLLSSMVVTDSFDTFADRVHGFEEGSTKKWAEQDKKIQVIEEKNSELACNILDDVGKGNNHFPVLVAQKNGFSMDENMFKLLYTRRDKTISDMVNGDMTKEEVYDLLTKRLGVEPAKAFVHIYWQWLKNFGQSLVKVFVTQKTIHDVDEVLTEDNPKYEKYKHDKKKMSEFAQMDTQVFCDFSRVVWGVYMIFGQDEKEEVEEMFSCVKIAAEKAEETIAEALEFYEDLVGDERIPDFSEAALIHRAGMLKYLHEEIQQLKDIICIENGEVKVKIGYYKLVLTFVN